MLQTSYTSGFTFSYFHFDKLAKIFIGWLSHLSIAFLIPRYTNSLYWKKKRSVGDDSHSELVLSQRPLGVGLTKAVHAVKRQQHHDVWQHAVFSRIRFCFGVNMASISLVSTEGTKLNHELCGKSVLNIIHDSNFGMIACQL